MTNLPSPKKLASVMLDNGVAVYYAIAPFIFLPQGGTSHFTLRLSLTEDASNLGSVFIEDPSVEIKIPAAERDWKNVESLSAKFDDQAKTSAKNWLALNGLRKLKAADRACKKLSKSYSDCRKASLAKAPRGKNSLPKGCFFATLNGHLFARNKKGLLVPNQGCTPHLSKQDVIDNFYAWKELSK